MVFKREDIIVRMAKPQDAEALAGLTQKSFGPYKVDWTDATHDWLVAEVAGSVYGCVQLCIGRPVGRLELLCVAETLTPRDKHAIMLELARGGMYALKETDAQIIIVFVEFASKGFKRMIKKRFGGRVTNSGNLVTAYLGTGV